MVIEEPGEEEEEEEEKKRKKKKTISFTSTNLVRNLEMELPSAKKILTLSKFSRAISSASLIACGCH